MFQLFYGSIIYSIFFFNDFLLTSYVKSKKKVQDEYYPLIHDQDVFGIFVIELRNIQAKFSENWLKFGPVLSCLTL